VDGSGAGGCHSQPKGPHQYIEGIKRTKEIIQNLKDAPSPTAILSQTLSQIEGLDSNRSQALTDFFNATLSRDPEKRPDNVTYLLSLIGKASAIR